MRKKKNSKILGNLKQLLYYQMHEESKKLENGVFGIDKLQTLFLLSITHADIAIRKLDESNSYRYR